MKIPGISGNLKCENNMVKFYDQNLRKEHKMYDCMIV